MREVDARDTATCYLSLQRACIALGELLKTNGVAQPAHEPIAIIGIGCRYPGGIDSLDAFWRVLRDGLDVVSELPADRFDVDTLHDSQSRTQGKIASRQGGFLQGVDLFDAGFFGIAPHEAVVMDPQQRLLLEVAWEAFEHAGLPQEKIAGSRTGVFVGMWAADYEAHVFEHSSDINLYAVSGGGRYSVSGRASYAFDLRGPSMTVDTACSSSLVAIHLACQSLRSRESNLALAAGVNAIVRPEITIGYSRAGMLSPDGRCKFGDASANGYVRSEGVGVLILKRLQDAVTDGDCVRGLILGSSVNNDGQGSGSFVAPAVEGQVAMLRTAYQNAGIAPGQVGYIEAHGTGTRAGDPVELRALATVLSEERPATRRASVGSVKTNIGHSESAAGIAGVIKAVLALQHKMIPASLHFREPNPSIPWAELPFAVQQEAAPWPVDPWPAVAGVNSFGITGTNAHVVLQEAPPSETTQHALAGTASEYESFLLPISAQSPQALIDLARRYREFLIDETTSPSLRDICYSAACRRTHQQFRWAAHGTTRQGLVEQIDGFLAEATASALRPADEPTDPVFVFPGQGSQWQGMARDLLDAQPAFAAAIARCDTAFRPYVEWSLRDVLQSGSPIDRIEMVQPVLFGVQVALARMWQSYGVRPKAVVGHSMGEVAAAHIADILTLEDAARIICERSRLLQSVSGQGAMAAIGLPRHKVEEALVGREAALSVAVVNSLQSTVVSGDPSALAQVMDELRAQNVFCRAIAVDVASHSPQMDPLLDDLRRVLNGIVPQPATIPFYSTVTGRLVEGEAASSAFGPAYWLANLRQPVRFSTAIQAAIESGATRFAEMSPHPILTAPVEEMFDHLGVEGLAVPAMRRGEDGTSTFLQALVSLYAHGHQIDWERLYPDGGTLVDLPRYPWQHKSYWLEPSQSPTTRRQRGKPASMVSKSTAPGPVGHYIVEWREHPESPRTSGSETERWLILADGQGMGDALAAEAAKRGIACVVATIGADVVRSGLGRYALDPQEPDQIERLLDLLNDDGFGVPTEIVHLWALDTVQPESASGSSVVASQRGACGSALALTQALAGKEWATAPRLRFITRGAQAVSNRERAAVEQAALWGLARVVATEHPELWGGIIDLDPMPSSDESALLCAELLVNDRDQVALRSGKRLTARLAQISRATYSLPDYRVDATYLITGGMGGLGLKLAQWLVSHGARHLALLGRSAPGEHAVAAIDAMTEVGATVRTFACDASDESTLAQTLDVIRREMPEIRGVFHAAGVLDDHVLSGLDWPAFAGVLSPKVGGAWNLHRLTLDLPLDHFMLFSSAVALCGTASQGNYAAANTFLDALAHRRHAAGLPALSVNWGVWSEVGLAAKGTRAERMDERGIQALTPEEGLASLGELLAQPHTQAAVLRMDWESYLSQLPAESQVLFADLATVETSPTIAVAADTASLARVRLEQAARQDRARLLVEEVLAIVARVLRYDDVSVLSAKQGFFTIGLDSLTALELRRTLQSSFDLVLPATVAFDYPTATTLADYLAGRLFPDIEPVVVVEPSSDDTPVDDLKDLSTDELQALLDLELESIDHGVLS